MAAIVSRAQVDRALGAGHRVTFTSYVLGRGWMLAALERAAQSGAAVTVRLEGRPTHDERGALAKINLTAVKALRQLGADAKLVDTNTRNGPAMHMKAAVCDGVAYLDDLNWPAGGDTIVRDDRASDVASIEAAAGGKPAAPAGSFWTHKAEALRGERDLIEGGRNQHTIDIESESFAQGSGTYGALKRLAGKGVRCRLLVYGRDVNDGSREALRRLIDAGVDVREGNAREKMAVVNGRHAWIGSANSTSAYYDGDQVEWGLRTDSARMSAQLQSRFDSNWSAAKRVV